MIVLWELLYRWVMLDSFASMNKPVLLALNNFFGSHWDSSSEISTTDKCYTTNRFSLKISSLLNAGLALALEKSSYLWVPTTRFTCKSCFQILLTEWWRRPYEMIRWNFETRTILKNFSCSNMSSQWGTIMKKWWVLHNVHVFVGLKNHDLLVEVKKSNKSKSLKWQLNSFEATGPSKSRMTAVDTNYGEL